MSITHIIGAPEPHYPVNVTPTTPDTTLSPADETETAPSTTSSGSKQARGEKGDFESVRAIINIDGLRSETEFNPTMWDGMRLQRFYGGEDWWQGISGNGFGHGWIVRDPVAQQGLLDAKPWDYYGTDPLTGESTLEEGTYRTAVRNGFGDWSKPYGFRFLMNPSMVSEHYATAPGVDVDGFLRDIADSDAPPVIAQTGVGMSFSLLLDRQMDIKWMESRGIDDALMSKYRSVTRKDLEMIRRYGTMWDLEYLFRTVNGDPPGGLWHKRETSDFGIFIPYPVIVNIGDGPHTRRIRGSIMGIQFKHTMFAPGMIPIRTEVSFNITRHSDAWYTNEFIGETGDDSTTGAGTSSPGFGGGVTSLPEGAIPGSLSQKTAPTIRRGSWQVVHKHTLTKGVKWIVEIQATYDLRSASNIRGRTIEHGFRRVGWGAQSSGGYDFTGGDERQVPTSGDNSFQFITTHTLSGGGPLEFMINVDGSGTIKLSTLVVKATPIGYIGSPSDDTFPTTGNTGDVESLIPAAYRTKYINTGKQVSVARALERARALVGKSQYQNKCIQFVTYACYGNAIGSIGMNSAYMAWGNAPASLRHPGDFNPPPGAVCLWNSSIGGGHGHATISIGGGKMITTTNGAIKIDSIWRNAYYGWIPPVFLGTNRRL